MIMLGGGIVAMIIGLILMRWLTLRTILTLLLVSSLVGLLLVIFVPVLIVTAVGLFIVYGARGMLVDTSTAYLAEMLSARVSVKAFSISACILSLGIPLTGAGFYFIKQ